MILSITSSLYYTPTVLLALWYDNIVLFVHAVQEIQHQLVALIGQCPTLRCLEPVSNMQELVVEVLDTRHGFAWVPCWNVKRMIHSGIVRGRAQDTESTNRVEPVSVLDAMKLNARLVPWF